MNDPISRLVRSVANSRFLMISALMHLILVLLFGGTVLFSKYVEPPDFQAEGGDFLTAGDAGAPEPPQQTEAMPTPTMSVATPTVTAPTTALTAITSMNPSTTSFAVPVAPSIAPTLSTDLSEKMAAPAAASAAKGGATGHLPGVMGGRGSERRAATMQQFGGKQTSEQAVMNALRWLQKVQRPDGFWGDKHPPAMTGLALLCFMGHGETHLASREFSVVVDKGITALINEASKYQGKLGWKQNSFDSTDAAYRHAIGTYALGEAYTMTKDEKIAPVLQQAIGYIVKGQRSDGGWAYRYELDDKSDEHGSPKSDTSVCGWQVQALKAAHLTGLNIPGVDEALDKSMRNFERVYDPKSSTFGYRKPGDGHPNLTGVGVLCRLFWLGKSDKMIRDALKTIEGKDIKYANTDANIYAWYYNTQACFMAQGGAWDRWNRAFQDEIVSHQSPDGSWPPTGAAAVLEKGKTVDKETGGMNAQTIDAQVYRTTLCVLMLEVYYRYLPTGKEGGTGLSAPSNL